MNERKEVLALARKQHADGIQKVKDTKEAAAVAAAAARQAELDKANGETNDGDGESGEGAEREGAECIMGEKVCEVVERGGRRARISGRGGRNEVVESEGHGVG